MRLYADYLNREYAPSDYVFVNLWGRPHGRPLTCSAVYELVERLRRRTGIGFEPRQFRSRGLSPVLCRCFTSTRKHR
ncbi:hypothetical protein ACF06W_22360 [Streptomyces albus]|uniref:hypothetical protein n=1 Tax=Streptomyces albus TaxID=1888 RepID=UPI0036F73AF9